MNTYTLYMHITPNEKVYIGITSQSVSTRWRKDGSGYRKHRSFWNAIQKYGWNNIEHVILATNLSKEWACKLEQFLVFEYRANDKNYGYNLSVGGEFNSGFHYQRTEEWKEKQRQMMTGTHHSEETKRKLSEINKNRSPELLKQISESLKKSTPQRVAKWKQTMAKKYPNGKHLSEEHKQKVSKALTGITRSEETKQKMRKPKSPEHIEHMREAQRISHKARKLGMTYAEYKDQQLTNIMGGK